MLKNTVLIKHYQACNITKTHMFCALDEMHILIKSHMYLYLAGSVSDKCTLEKVSVLTVFRKSRQEGRDEIFSEPSRS